MPVRLIATGVDVRQCGPTSCGAPWPTHVPFAAGTQFTVTSLSAMSSWPVTVAIGTPACCQVSTIIVPTWVVVMVANVGWKPNVSTVDLAGCSVIFAVQHSRKSPSAVLPLPTLVSTIVPAPMSTDSPSLVRLVRPTMPAVSTSAGTDGVGQFGSTGAVAFGTTARGGGG